MQYHLSQVAWPTVQLKTVALVQTGVAKGAKIPRDPVVVPYLRVANVQAGALDLSEITTIAIDGADLGRYSLRAGDVLMTEGGDFDKLGRGAIWTGEIDPCIHQNHVFAVRCDAAKLSPEWLSWVAGSHYGRRYFMLCSKQSTNLASINSTQLKAFPLPIPSIAQQRKIMRIMKAADQALAHTSKLIDTRLKFKRGLMQQLLTGHRRFKGFRKRCWNEVYLGDVFNERNEINQLGLPLLSVTGDRGVIPRDALVKRDSSNPDKSKYKRVAIGDIAYNTMRMWQGVSALSLLEGIVSPAYTIAIPGEKIYGPFARYLFKYPPVINLFHRHSQGLVDDTLNLKYDRFAKIKLRIPTDFNEQVKIANALNLCGTAIELLSALRKQFEDQKRALLARLLSGDLAVPS